MLAHGIGGREDLPLPLEWVIAGAAVAVLVSFVALGALWREPRLRGAEAGRPLPAGLAALLDARWFRRTLAAVGAVFAGYVALALVFGKDDANNPVPWVVYVLIWVGLVPVSVLLGPVWRQLSPLRTIHTGLNRILGLDPREGMAPLPAWVGWWPAAFGLFAFTWMELIADDPASLTVLRAAIGLYAGLQLLAALYFGSDWFTRGEAFEAWSGLFGRFSALGRRQDGVLVLRNPLAGLDALRPHPGLVATVVVMLSSTAFDSFSGSSRFQAFAQSSPMNRTLLDTLALLLVIAVIGGLFVLCTMAAGRLGGVPARTMPGLFAHSVVPVALGYVLAHYYSFLVLEGQQAFVQLTDPLGIGANWLGTGGLTPDATLVNPTLVANFQVAAIVAGHIIGVALAHERAVQLFPRRVAVLGQLPLLLLMVALTCLGLLLLFAS